jgi:glycosyltransferase involved in cell wall biosynthesis
MDGENGYLIPDQDADILAERLTELIDDPSIRWRFSQKSRQHASIHFDARVNAARMLEILVEIVRDE